MSTPGFSVEPEPSPNAPHPSPCGPPLPGLRCPPCQAPAPALTSGRMLLAALPLRANKEQAGRIVQMPSFWKSPPPAAQRPAFSCTFPASRLRAALGIDVHSA